MTSPTTEHPSSDKPGDPPVNAPTRAVPGEGAAAPTARPSSVRARASASPLTGRAALLAVVIGTLVLSLALPVREYVRQRSEISALQAEKASREAQVAALQSRLKQWDDPAFVQTQARQRLQYVMPGEVGYVVLDPAEAPAPTRERVEAATTRDEQSWYTRLWGSVDKADQPTP